MQLVIQFKKKATITDLSHFTNYLNDVLSKTYTDLIESWNLNPFDDYESQKDFDMDFGTHTLKKK